MKTITKAVLVAMSVTALAAPVMARHAASSIETHASSVANDCVHVQFPQCSDSTPWNFDR
jgi:hypothetical protein